MRITRLMGSAFVIGGLMVAAHAEAAGDPAAGARAFAGQCATCHTTTAAKSGFAGPSLKGVAGRKVAGAPDFAYSAALKAKGGTWTDTALDAYLAGPSKFAPGGKMMTTVANADARAALIAYLKTQN